MLRVLDAGNGLPLWGRETIHRFHGYVVEDDYLIGFFDLRSDDPLKQQPAKSDDL